MILDYYYSKTDRILSVSYIKNNGAKALMNFNVDKFKTYYSTPNGRYTNWDGSKCDVKYVDKPKTFDIKTFFKELPDKYRKLLMGKIAPLLYTWDIETEVSDEFPDPTQAKYAVTTISIASPDCNVVVLGTKALSQDEINNIETNFQNYVNKCSFFRSLNLPTPFFRYIKFNTERDMLEYFLTNIVSKVPILAGWNSILFDWQYIHNRIAFYYPQLSLKLGSINHTLTSKNYTDQRQNKINLRIPNHTLLLDMMDVIGNFDMVVMPIKESLALDYISSETIKIGKIKYDGSLQDLYENNYPKYVFYNCIDSVLVQLIDKYFKTLQNIYTQALYCEEKIGSCFSKIALTEALVFKDYYEQNIKIVDDFTEIPDRGELVGAYVRQPTPGKHKFVCCNDFASLYPSTIITCNLSYDNIIGKGFSEEELNLYRKDKNYFVSVNGVVYKNDKDYSFKRIQSKLKADRNVGKYLAKQLDAQVMTDVTHILKGMSIKNQQYPENIIHAIEEIGYNIKCTDDIKSIDNIEKFKDDIKKEIIYYTSYEQAMKLLGNSMYGGSSHVSFFWFNMDLANDITGEARNLIHLMESHIPEFFKQNWHSMRQIHKNLGIDINEQKYNDIMKYKHELVNIVYGDTDSLYISYDNLLNTIDNIEKMSIQEKLNIIVNLNRDFLDKHNEQFMDEYFKMRHAKSIHNFELETVALSGVWLDVKKRYAQILLWKDGKFFDIDDLPMKIKGLEMVKSSVPKQARESLKRLVRYLLEEQDESYMLQKMNVKSIAEKQKWFEADLEDICGSVGVQNYTKYILDDTNPIGLKVAPKCPYNVKALGNYNRIRQAYNLPGDPIYGGKIKWYKYLPAGKMNLNDCDYFAFQSKNYPKWAEKYAPISKDAMYQQFVLDPLNRILTAIGIGELRLDGSIQCSLF